LRETGIVEIEVVLIHTGDLQLRGLEPQPTSGLKAAGDIVLQLRGQLIERQLGGLTPVQLILLNLVERLLDALRLGIVPAIAEKTGPRRGHEIGLPVGQANQLGDIPMCDSGLHIRVTAIERL
jgi:hypothetical protein